MSVKFTQHAEVMENDLETPVGMFLRLAGEQQGILLESTETDGKWGRHSIIAKDFIMAISCVKGCLHVDCADELLIPSVKRYSGSPFLEGLRALIENLYIEPADERITLPPIARALYGYLGYEMSALFEPRLAKALGVDNALASLVLPRTLIIFDHLYNKITHLNLQIDGRKPALLPQEQAAQTNSLSPQPLYERNEQKKYTDGVRKIKKKLREGESLQIVIATAFQSPLADKKPFDIYRRLRQINPSPYLFYMNMPDGIFLGSSPEVLIKCDQNLLQLSPIAGTRPRSQDPAEDMFFGDELLQDPKEQAEHVMLVDLGRNDLGRIATTGSVKVNRFMDVERFSHVMHLTSYLSATLKPGLDAIDVLQAVFPAGTVSGAPKIRAMELIAEIEQSARGPYAGGIGWIGLDKDSVNLDFGIAIRSLHICDGVVHWQTGAGIVQDSVPEKEWIECQTKAAVIKSALSL